jgi:hypothetical protein
VFALESPEVLCCEWLTIFSASARSKLDLLIGGVGTQRLEAVSDLAFAATLRFSE